ncbi:perlucin-like protein isoform X2 [Ostrea edulis]|uniref:perlucin-like protein isoform X2 n=1 Tax=Ostrea edulis TaxID=37623 RepID=UPI002095A533|nr:perlucin-like protein isoform X2 [Ostrea edulis]
MRRLFTLVTFLILLQGVTSECPLGWVFHGSSCYLFVYHHKDWTAAEDDCKSQNSYLVNIGDGAENEFLRTVLHVQENEEDFWIGATDAIVEGGWRWMPHFDKIDYNDWIPGQPNDNHNQDCMQLYHAVQYHWDDDHCEEQKYFICEKENPSEELQVIG